MYNQHLTPYPYRSSLMTFNQKPHIPLGLLLMHSKGPPLVNGLCDRYGQAVQQIGDLSTSEHICQTKYESFISCL